jgi:hypothetical protein
LVNIQISDGVMMIAQNNFPMSMCQWL